MGFHYGDSAHKILEKYHFSEDVCAYAWALLVSLGESGRSKLDENDVYKTIAGKFLPNGSCTKDLLDKIRSSGVLQKVVRAVLVEECFSGSVPRFSLTGQGREISSGLLKIVKDESGKYDVE